MKALCSVCKTVLLDEKDGEAVCPNCHAVYRPASEIIQYEDEDFSSSHSDEMPEITGTGGSVAGIMAATDEQDPNLTDALYKHWKHKPNEGENAEKWD
jgi:uncharacterized Zn finger protein (UPF0148 family)